MARCPVTDRSWSRAWREGRGSVSAGSASIRNRLQLIALCLEALDLIFVPSSAARGGWETGGGSGAGLARLDLTIARRRVGNERIEQLMRGFGHPIDRPAEGWLVGLRGPGEAAELADELERGRADLLVGGGRLEVVQNPDVATHEKPRERRNQQHRRSSDAMHAFRKGRTDGRHDQVRALHRRGRRDRAIAGASGSRPAGLHEHLAGRG